MGGRLLTHCRAHNESAAYHAYDCSRKPAGSRLRRCTSWSSRQGSADLLQHIMVLESYSMLQKQACKEDDQHASRSCCLPASPWTSHHAQPMLNLNRE